MHAILSLLTDAMALKLYIVGMLVTSGVTAHLYSTHGIVMNIEQYVIR